MELYNDTLVDLFWAMDHARYSDGDDDGDGKGGGGGGGGGGSDNRAADGGSGGNGDGSSRKDKNNCNNNTTTTNHNHPHLASNPPHLDILTDAYDTVYIRNSVVKTFQSHEDMMALFYRASQYRHVDLVNDDGYHATI